MAEGIKISEMEQVATLEDGCCFPVVSNGENKKITQKNLYSLMTANLQNQINSINEESNFKLKTGRVSGKSLGFGTNSTVSVYDFWVALSNNFKSANNVNLVNACLDVSWSGAEQCYISDGYTNVLFNSGILTFTGTLPVPWGNFTALYLDGVSHKYFVISCYIGGDSMNAISSHIREISNTGEITNLQNQINNLSNSVPAQGLSKELNNVMSSSGSIDFNTNKAVLQLPIYSKDATNQPTAAGAIWIQEVEVTE